MKTRAEIYSKEAADILRNITTYHYMRHDQLLRLYPGKEEKIDNLLSFFLRQGRIFRDEHSGLYHDGTEAHADKEMRLHRAPGKQKDDLLQGFCTYT